MKRVIGLCVGLGMVCFAVAQDAVGQKVLFPEADRAEALKGMAWHGTLREQRAKLEREAAQPEHGGPPASRERSAASAESAARYFRMERVAFEDSPRSYLEALGDVAESSTLGVHAQNIIQERPSDFGVLPALANVQGAFGAYYTSDVFFVNPHPSGVAVVDMYFLPNGQDNVAVSPLAKRFSLNALTGDTEVDILRTVFGVTGKTGAIFYAVDHTSSTGTSNSLSLWAYTSTPAPGGGRFGSSVHGVGEPWSDSLFDGWCVGARSDSTARTNTGLYNRGLVPLSVSVQTVSSAGQSSNQTIIVPAAGFIQVPLTTPFQYSNALVYFHSLTSNTGWFSYVAVADNVTNDFNFQYSTGW